MQRYQHERTLHTQINDKRILSPKEKLKDLLEDKCVDGKIKFHSKQEENLTSVVKEWIIMQ